MSERVGRLILGLVDRKWEERGFALFTIFNEHAGNVFLWLADMRHVFHCVSRSVFETEDTTWCGRKVMRLATLCANRQRCCLPIDMAVRLTPALDSVPV